MTTLLIRDAVADDAPEVARIHVQSWRAAYRGLIAQEVLDGLSISERTEGWRRGIEEPLPTGLGLLVADRGDSLAGWVSFGSGRDPDGVRDGEIYGIYADPRCWSTGAGHALLVAAEERLLSAGHDRAYLWVLDGNDRADRFYARQGWVEDGAIKVEERPSFTLNEHRRVKHLRPS